MCYAKGISVPVSREEMFRNKIITTLSHSQRITKITFYVHVLTNFNLYFQHFVYKVGYVFSIQRTFQ